MEKQHLRNAVEIVGGQSALARALTDLTGKKYRQGHIWQWLNNYDLPAQLAVPIETITEGAVSRHELRPDVFGPKPTEAA